MAKIRFSKNYNTYIEWIVDNSSNTGYTGRIKRLHSLYPNASLSELRGHANKNNQEQGLAHQTPDSIFKRSEQSYPSLTPREKATYARGLDVIKKVRTGKSFTRACKEVGIKPEQVLSQGLFYKQGRLWKVPASDNFVRHLKINENGRMVIVSVRGSGIASMIGSYHNAVRRFLETGDTSDLRAFQYTPFTDIKGLWHSFETRPQVLKSIVESLEDEEFGDIYAE